MKNYSPLFLSIALIMISTNAKSQTYCTPPKYISGPYTGITNVKAGTINNTSPNNDGYKDFTTTVGLTNMIQGQNISFSITCYYDPSMLSSFAGNLNIRVWIDWNGDYDFVDAGEEVVTKTLSCAGSTTSNPNTTANYSFTVPLTAKIGTTRMRVYEDMPVSDGHDAPNPCGYKSSSNTLGQHGECEDYNINVVVANGVNEISSSNNSLSIFPNPCKDFVVINLQTISNPSKIFIYDITGKMVKQFDVMANEPKMKLDVGDLPKGLYFVSLNGYSSKLNLE